MAITLSQILDNPELQPMHPQTSRQTVIQPHRVPDDLDRIPVALIRRPNRHRPILAAPHQVNNLTMPFNIPAYASAIVSTDEIVAKLQPDNPEKDK